MTRPSRVVFYKNHAITFSIKNWYKGKSQKSEQHFHPSRVHTCKKNLDTRPGSGSITFSLLLERLCIPLEWTPATSFRFSESKICSLFWDLPLTFFFCTYYIWHNSSVYHSKPWITLPGTIWKRKYFASIVILHNLLV